MFHPTAKPYRRALDAEWELVDPRRELEHIFC